MKSIKIILLALLCLAGTHPSLLAKSRHSLVTLKVLPYEGDTITDSFSISVKIKFLDTVHQVSPLLVHLPSGWSMMDTAVMDTSTLYYPSDSLMLTFHCAYPDTGLPFYPEILHLGIKFRRAFDASITDSATNSVYIYFTPYNSVEVMSTTEYNNRKRIWLAKEIPVPTRSYIPKASIPISNILDTFQIREEWQKHFQNVYLPGMAYAIQMMPISPDTISAKVDMEGSGGMNKISFTAT